MKWLGILYALIISVAVYHQETAADGELTLHAAFSDRFFALPLTIFCVVGALFGYWIATAKVGDLWVSRFWSVPSDTYLIPFWLTALAFFQALGQCLGLLAVGIWHDASAVWAAGGMLLPLLGVGLGLNRRRSLPRAWVGRPPWGVRPECRERTDG